jgi:hypothetical protein
MHVLKAASGVTQDFEIRYLNQRIGGPALGAPTPFGLGGEAAGQLGR